jgi:hypothetical protein
VFVVEGSFRSDVLKIRNGGRTQRVSSKEVSVAKRVSDAGDVPPTQPYLPLSAAGERVRKDAAQGFAAVTYF